MPSRLTTTLWVGGSGVRPESTRKVVSAESSAEPTAIDPIIRNEMRRPPNVPLFRSGKEWSALAIAPGVANRSTAAQAAAHAE